MREFVSAILAAHLATESVLVKRGSMECCALVGLSILSDLGRSDRWTLLWWTDTKKSRRTTTGYFFLKIGDNHTGA